MFGLLQSLDIILQLHSFKGQKVGVEMLGLSPHTIVVCDNVLKYGGWSNLLDTLDF